MFWAKHSGRGSTRNVIVLLRIFWSTDAPGSTSCPLFNTLNTVGDSVPNYDQVSFGDFLLGEFPGRDCEHWWETASSIRTKVTSALSGIFLYIEDNSSKFASTWKFHSVQSLSTVSL